MTIPVVSTGLGNPGLRRFAAEFLCPVSSLVEFLDGDFSETAVEDAADHFSVSERTVESLLMNNGYFPRPAAKADMPYDLTGDLDEAVRLGN